LAERGDKYPPLLGESLPALHVKFVFIPEAAHQPPARARNLGRIQREPLVFGNAEVDWAKLREPGGGAILPSAPPNPVETFGFVTHTDLFELDTCAKRGGEFTNEIAEI